MKMKKFLLGFMIIFLISLTTILLFAQEQVEVDKRKNTGIAERKCLGKKKKRRINRELTADRFSYDRKRFNGFGGNMVIIQEDTTLTQIYVLQCRY